MKRAPSTLFVFGLLILPALGQTAQKLTEMSKKVAGKWWTGNQKMYIEFLTDSACSTGSLFPDGTWQVEKGKLKIFESQRDYFTCDIAGAVTMTLELVGPNKMTLVHGWIDEEPTKLYRGLENLPKVKTTITVSEANQIGRASCRERV